MPPKPKPLEAGQVDRGTIVALERFLVAKLGEAARYKQLPDPFSLGRVGVHSQPSVALPRFTLVVDTAEQDHVDLVQRLRLSSYWAVARSMKRPPSAAASENFFAGDFAVLEWLEDVDEDDSGDAIEEPYAIPLGYVALVDVERKTINDLIASMKDGRSERQMAEQLASSAKRHVMLVEGDVNELAGGPAAHWLKPVNSRLDHLAYAGEMHLRQIASHADLLGTLGNLVRYSARDILDSEKGITRYLSHSMSGKRVRRIDTPEAVWLGVLQAVPGISPAAAAAVTQQAFGSFVAFARAIVSAADDDTGVKRQALVKTLGDVSVASQSSSSSRAATHLRSRGTDIVDMFLPDAKRQAAPESSSSASGKSSPLRQKRTKSPPPREKRTKSTTARNKRPEPKFEDISDDDDPLPSRPQTTTTNDDIWDSD